MRVTLIDTGTQQNDQPGKLQFKANSSDLKSQVTSSLIMPQDNRQ